MSNHRHLMILGAGSKMDLAFEGDTEFSITSSGLYRETSGRWRTLCIAYFSIWAARPHPFYSIQNRLGHRRFFQYA
jgi:hypothetical protein